MAAAAESVAKQNQGLAGKGAPAPRVQAPLPGAGVQKKCHPLPPGKKGVLRIRGGDVESGFATIFFLYAINHVMYAELHGLIPWIDLSPQQAKHVYDKSLGENAWEAYFEPLSNASMTYRYCDALEVEFVYDCVWPWIHHEVPWAVRAWYYGREEKLHEEETFDEPWFRNNRLRAAMVVAKYWRPRSWVTERVDTLWHKMIPEPGTEVLGMHMRGTDKAAGRRRVKPQEYLEYAKMFVRSYPKSRIYLATDDSRYLKSVTDTWPKHLVERIAVLPADVIHRSGVAGADGAVFKMFGHSATNIEVLTDIMMLSRCTALVYGASAVAESAFYLNPLLHWSSVHLEYKKGRQAPAWAQPQTRPLPPSGPHLLAPYSGNTSIVCPYKAVDDSEDDGDEGEY